MTLTEFHGCDALPRQTLGRKAESIAHRSAKEAAKDGLLLW